MGTRCVHRPRAVYPGSFGGVAAPLIPLLCPCVVRHTLTGPTRIPCSVVPPPRSSSSTYRILGPVFFLGLSRLVISSYPPRLPAPLNTRPSRPSFTAALTRKVSKCWAAASEAMDGVSICCGVCAPWGKAPKYLTALWKKIKTREVISQHLEGYKRKIHWICA